MKNLVGKIGIFCMAAVMLASLLLATLLPIKPALAESGAGDAVMQPVTVDTHLNTEDLITVFDTAATEGPQKVNVTEMDTGTLTTVFGLSQDLLPIEGRVNAGDNNEEGVYTNVGVFERDSDNSLRMHYDWYGATLSRQKLMFEEPISVADLGGLAIGIYLHTGAETPFQTVDGTYGMLLYSSDDTGAKGEGILIPNTTKQDEWTNLVISKNQLFLLADENGMLSGLQIGSRFHFADVNGPNLPDTSKGAAQGYIKIKDIKKVANPVTLQKAYGQTTEIEGRFLLRPIEEVSDSTATDNDSYFFRMNWYAVTTSTAAIVFDEPVNVEEISKLVVRLKVDADVAEDPYFTNEMNGIMLYSLDAVGELGEGVQLQSKNITQREWVDYSISYEQAKKLAGADGYIRGIQLGARFNWGESHDLNQSGDYSYGYGHPIVGGTDDNLTINIDTVSYVPYAFDGYLTQGDGGTSAPGTSTIVEINGVSGDDFDGLHHALNQGDIKVVGDPDAVDGSAFKINLFAWSAVRSTNYVEYREPVSVDDVDGLVVRLKLHISASQPYASAAFGYGVYLYDKGATGTAAEQFTIPQDTLQEKYVNVYIGKNDVVRMAGADGMLEGLQIASYLNIGQDPDTYSDGEPYIMIDYIAVSQNAEIKFMDGDEVLKTDTAPTFFETTENYFIPQKEGKLFLGWKSGDTYFDFSEPLAGNITLTASWVDRVSDVSSYYGLYKSQDGAYITLTENGIDVTSVTDAYSYWGIGTDENLYVVNGTEQYVLDLNGDFTKVDSVTVTYNTKIASNPAVQRLVEKNTATEAPDITRNGYRLTNWVDADGNVFDFTTVLTDDITLTAVYEPVEIEDADQYFGTYYNKTTGRMIVLSESNKATFTENGQETIRKFYILKDNVISFEQGDDFAEGTVLAARFLFEDVEYIRLTQYLVTFDTDGGSEIDRQTISSACGYRAERPADPTKDGYTFVGWYLSDNTLFDFETVVTESLTLYAHWEFSENSGNSTGKDKKGCNGAVEGTSALIGILAMGLAVVMVAKRKNRS